MANVVVLKTVLGVLPDGKLDVKDVPYQLNLESDLPGFGTAMELGFLKTSIMKQCGDKVERYKEALASKDVPAMNQLGEENVAIILGKESLMLLLSQKDCEGIRFYFCKNPYGRNSVAAVGVKKDQTGEIRDIGIDDADPSASILTAKQISGNVLNKEVGPPDTIAKLFSKDEKPTQFISDLKNFFNIQ